MPRSAPQLASAVWAGGSGLELAWHQLLRVLQLRGLDQRVILWAGGPLLMPNSASRAVTGRVWRWLKTAFLGRGAWLDWDLWVGRASSHSMPLATSEAVTAVVQAWHHLFPTCRYSNTPKTRAQTPLQLPHSKPPQARVSFSWGNPHREPQGSSQESARELHLFTAHACSRAMPAWKPWKIEVFCGPWTWFKLVQ